jgi:hypothetical protein
MSRVVDEECNIDVVRETEKQDMGGLDHTSFPSERKGSNTRAELVTIQKVNKSLAYHQIP